MQTAQPFQLLNARRLIEQALEKAGFDVIADSSEPDIIQARRQRGGDSTAVVIDSGGQMRFTRTRQTGPEQAETHKTSGGRAFQITRQSNETVTVSHQLSSADSKSFATILAALDQM